MKVWIVAAAVAAFASGCATVARPGTAPEMASVNALVERNVTAGFSGAVLIARGDRVLLSKGYGSIGGVAMRPATRFWISSMGKQFVSAAILRLQDEGKLRLDDPLPRFVDGVPADKRSITIRQLLTHTSGFPQGYVGEQALANAEAIRLLLAVPLARPPGDGFGYSNDNYQLAAALVERLSGVSFANFEARELLAPLGLRDIGMANGPAGTAPTRDPAPGRLSVTRWGIGGHFASAPDLFRWTRAVLNGRVLSRGSLRDLTNPTVKIQEGETALGWFANRSARGTRRLWTRGNDDYGPNSLIYLYPDRDMTIIILTHAGDRDVDSSWSRALLADIEEDLKL